MASNIKVKCVLCLNNIEFNEELFKEHMTNNHNMTEDGASNNLKLLQAIHLLSRRD